MGLPGFNHEASDLWLSSVFGADVPMGEDTQAGDQGQLTFPGKMFTLPRAEVAKVNLVKQVPRQMTPNLVKEQRACTGMWDTSHQFKGVFLR